MTRRSYLYVPGNRPDRFERALASGADAVILDLEDGVPASAKDDARAAVAAFLARRARGGAEVWVRLNGGDRLEDDVRAAAGADGVSLPKASLPEVERLCALAGAMHVSALLETAAGILDARAIASHPRVSMLQLGEADLGAELGVEPSEDGREMAAVRAMVVLASAAAGVDPPVAPISTDFRDLEAFRRSTDALRRAGFGGRAAIHPAQVAVINDVYTPAPDEVEAARAIVAAFEAAGGGATTGPDGRMIDEAVVRAARATLARAGG